MNAWLAALTAHDGPAVLVTVAHTEGSVPREAGAKMLVTPAQQHDTIGGGHLEFCAAEFARSMLSLPDNDLLGQRRLERFPLGPTLGQCCGGVVTLAFERIEAAARDVYRGLQRSEACRRMVALDPVDGIFPFPVLRRQDDQTTCHLQRDADGIRWLIDPWLPACAHLYLFGAGHVGAALVRALADLPCLVTWVDERDDLFPAEVPANVSCEVTDTAESVIDHAPANASFLVMTHSHALDQRLAEQILRRDDVGWFGLIGSRTKRIQFERRLRARGIPATRLEQMVCPIGIEGINGKEPALIAVAVAAQLLQIWERQQTASIIELVAATKAC